MEYLISRGAAENGRSNDDDAVAEEWDIRKSGNEGRIFTPMPITMRPTPSAWPPMGPQSVPLPLTGRGGAGMPGAFWNPWAPGVDCMGFAAFFDQGRPAPQERQWARLLGLLSLHWGHFPYSIVVAMMNNQEKFVRLELASQGKPVHPATPLWGCGAITLELCQGS